MAHSDDLRKRVVEAVFRGGMSRNAAAERFEVSIASAVRWAHRFSSTGAMSPAPTGGDRRSDRIEAHSDYLLGLIRRQSDITLLEIQERLIANCGERFSSSVIWRFFDRHGITFKKNSACQRTGASGRPEAAPRVVWRPTRSRSENARIHRRNGGFDQSGAKGRTLPTGAKAARRHSPWPLQNRHAGRRSTPFRPRRAESVR
jgi:transposase